MADGKLAIDFSNDIYVSGFHNGNADAFRHVLWNYFMVLDVGYYFAKKWSDAHENGFVNNPFLEKTMDLHNNKIGLELGRNNLTPFRNTAKNKSLEAIRSGKGVKIGGITLIPTNRQGER